MRTALIAAMLFALALAGAATAAELKPWNAGATPALVLKDPAGEEHNLAKFRGKVVLVNFWATWCEPCRAEMPSMQRLRDRFAAQAFAVLAVNYMESSEKISIYRESQQLDLTLLADRDGAAAKRWKVRILPSSFVVDRQGTVRYQLVGEADWTDPEIVGKIKRLIGADDASIRAGAARRPMRTALRENQ